MIMNKLLMPAAGAAGLLMMLGAAQAQEAEPRGVIAGGPPQDISLTVTTGPNGEPILSENEYQLNTGGYYRFNFICPDAADDATGFHFEAPDLVANSHIRVYSVGDIELYLQGQTFRAIECDEPGHARFSFHPMRGGTYQLYVRDHSDPPKEAFGQFVVTRGD